MAVTNSGYFDAMASEYDSIARRGMPRRDEMLAEIERWLPVDASDVLELGCGTGAVTILLAQRYPHARITAVDGSQEMLAIAGRRLAGTPVAFVAGTFEELQVPERSFDVAASNMSLHHVADKASVYRAIRRALRPGGTFVLGDEVLGATPEAEQRLWNEWLEFARRPGGLTEDEIASINAHAQAFDHYETLAGQLALLQEAGFEAADCVWRYRIYGVFVARA